MTAYQASIVDRIGSAPQTILLAGTHFSPADLPHHRATQAPGALAEALFAVQPDVLVMDAAQASADVVDALGSARLAGLPIVVVTGDAEGDAAGLLLDFRILGFLAPDARLESLMALLETGGPLLADAGARFDPDSRIAALRRDAERVAAALAELANEGSTPASLAVDAPRIRAHIKARRLRERFFAAEMFADPAWDILLDLAAARLEGRRVSVSSLCIAATVPTTTGLRWIKTMIDQKMLVRSSDPTDARRAFIAMETGTAAAMTACLEACLNLQGQ